MGLWAMWSHVLTGPRLASTTWLASTWLRGSHAAALAFFGRYAVAEIDDFEEEPLQAWLDGEDGEDDASCARTATHELCFGQLSIAYVEPS